MGKVDKRSREMKVGVSCLLPVYNEEKNIKKVLNFLTSCDFINETIVVDDGSTDGSGKIIKEFSSKVTIVSNKKNIGKTQSLIIGAKKAKFNSLLFYDADMVGVRKADVKKVIGRFNQGFAMVIMDKGSQPLFFRVLLKSVPALSGVRILGKDVFLSLNFSPKDRFALETKINDYFLKNSLSIAVIFAPYARDPRKYEKYSLAKGLFLDLKALLEISLIKNPIKALLDFYRIKNKPTF